VVTEVVAAPCSRRQSKGRRTKDDTRGLGNVYRPSYRDKLAGELGKASTWWIVYHVSGRRIVENARTTKESEAPNLLKVRIGRVANGRPVGSEVARTTLDDLIAMGEADYKAKLTTEPGAHSGCGDSSASLLQRRTKGAGYFDREITAYAAHRLEKMRSPRR
jgi:hypothetical protein